MTTQAIRLLDIIEATSVNAVAKNALEFCRLARELKQRLPDSVTIETTMVTFERGRNSAPGDVQRLNQQGESGTSRASESPNEFVAAARALGLEVELIPERFRFDLRVISALREIALRRSPDIILTHHVKSHFLLKWSRLWQQRPWIAFHHGYTSTDVKTRAYNHLDRWSLPTADRVITVCQAFASDLAGKGVPPERISVLPNSIRAEQSADTEEAQALKARLGISEDERVVIAVGRLSNEKGHIDLISAWPHLLETNPDLNAKLVIVGDGPERGRLEAAAASLGIGGRVVFAGQVNRVRPFYAAADALALPSHSEGSSNVLLEAMAAGLPIVATAVGGVPETVSDEESALLVAPRDPRSLAAAIARVLTDGELACKLTANASALVTTQYSPESRLHTLIETYREVISSRDRQSVQAV